MRRLSGVAKIDSYAGHVVASDEAGLGSWAGPLLVCAVSAPIGWDDPRVKDSKQLTAEAREELYAELYHKEGILMWVEKVSPADIDRVGVYPALLAAHSTAHQKVSLMLGVPHLSIIDGSMPLSRISLGQFSEQALCLPKADALIPECALASITAKVVHDRAMAALDAKYPEYGFGSNQGYGGDTNHPHRQALMRLGPCPAHRMSYQPVQDAVASLDAGNQPTLDDLASVLDED